jgi:hypothetical protein
MHFRILLEIDDMGGRSYMTLNLGPNSRLVRTGTDWGPYIQAASLILLSLVEIRPKEIFFSNRHMFWKTRWLRYVSARRKGLVLTFVCNIENSVIMNSLETAAFS